MKTVKPMKIRLISLLLIFSACFSSAFADIVVGRVVDAQTKAPLPDAQIEVQQHFMGALISSSYTTDSLGVFELQAFSRQCVLSVEYLGYYRVRRNFLASEGEDTIRLGDIALKPSDAYLKMATVTGKMRRFVVHGDTVLFNPRAFKLDEGARLEELLKQLPGVTSKDGKLYWMNKPLRIVMNGSEIFSNGEALMGRLPVEAVDQIKAYNKQSEFARHTGRDDGKEDRVLDITIKKGWLDKWYGMLGASWQTLKRYALKVDAMRLSKQDPLLAYANINDKNSYCSRIDFNDSYNKDIDNFGREKAAAFGYKHSWQQAHKPEGQVDNFFAVTGSLGREHGYGTDYSTQENFLSSGAHSFGAGEESRYKRMLRPQLNFALFANIDSLTTLNMSANVGFNRTQSSRINRNITTDIDPYGFSRQPIDRIFDALPGDTLLRHTIATQRAATSGLSEAFTTNVFAYLNHVFPDKSELALHAEANYSHTRNDLNTLRRLRYFRTAGSNAYENQYLRSPERSLKTSATLYYNKWLSKQALFTFEYGFEYKRGLRRRDLFRLDRLPEYANPDAVQIDYHAPEEQRLLSVFDPISSYRHHFRETNNSAEASILLRWGKFSFKPELGWEYANERIEYRQGSIDTMAVRHQHLFFPHLKVEYKFSPTSILEANYGCMTTPPELINTIAYVDKSDPLFIRRGNPFLLNTHEHKAELAYYGNFTNHEQSVMFSLQYNKYKNPVQTTFFYDPATGVMQTSFANVRGGYDFILRTNYSRALNDQLTLANYLNVYSLRSYAYLTGTNPSLPLLLNKRHQWIWSDRIDLQYQQDAWDIKGHALFSYSRNIDDQAINAYPHYLFYKYGVTAKYRLRAWTFYTQLNVINRHGYNLSANRRHMFIWGAGATLKTLKGRGWIRLDVDDILNQQTYYETSLNAYQRTEQWHNGMHHYVRLSFSYDLDPKGQK